MGKKNEGRIPQKARWRVLAILTGTLLLAMPLYAPPIPPVLSISQPSSNSVTVTVVSGNAYNYALQMSTDLSTTNWTSLQSNYVVPTPIVFTNMPATNNSEYFRMMSIPP
jgi:hypothetical protein